LEALCKNLGLDPAERTAIIGGIVPQGGPNPSISGRAMVTVGDAAGLTNPFSSGGIHSALHSGRIAAETIVRGLESDGPVDLSSYETVMRDSPFCDPTLVEARCLLDDLTDEQWNFMLNAFKDRDLKGLGKMRSVTRMIVNSPFALPQIWALRSMGKAFRSYGTWGW
jgi:flavin-dependent dehydrogenase